MAGRATRLFTRCFGHPPRWLVAAPGRVNLIGEHTDYNDGFVLPMAIERYILFAADANTHSQVTLHSVTTGETATFSLRPKVERGEPAWSNYVRGVIAGFQAQEESQRLRRRHRGHAAARRRIGQQRRAGGRRCDPP